MNEFKQDLLRLKFNSKVGELKEYNSSFDKGVMRVAYTNENRNRSCISKSAFEKCIGTAANCPIVCNYDRDTDTIGGHDVDFVKDKDGVLKMVNLTQPVGVIPESANYWWETVKEKDGKTHEYLCLDILIWTRQEAYQKIKEDGIVAESMEIRIKSAEMIDLYCHIYDFEFLAFCLLGNVEPCFESAGIELMSLNENHFEQQYTMMLSDFKKAFSMENADMDIRKTTKGEENSLNKFENEIEKKPIGGTSIAEDEDSENKTETPETPTNPENPEVPVNPETPGGENNDPSQGGSGNNGNDNTQGDNSDPESNGNGGGDNGGAAGSGENPDESESGGGADDTEGGDGDGGDYSLNQSEFWYELSEQICNYEKMSDDLFGEFPRYYLIDYSVEKSVAYAEDFMDGRVYSVPYALHGDAVSVDFSCKKRQKYCFEDFVDTREEPEVSSGSGIYSNYKNAIKDKYTALVTENNELKHYRNQVLLSERQAVQENVFAEFDDLKGIEEFDNLRKKCKEGKIDKSPDDLRFMCYAIRGKNSKPIVKQSTTASFGVRIPIDTHTEPKDTEDNYGGVVERYKNKDI